MKILRTISKGLYALIITFLVLLGLVLSISLINIPGNYKLYTVQSGSMEPAIHTGSVILVKPQSNYIKNDIIAFGTDPKSTTTHRIFDIKKEDGVDKFQTKGDANDSPDGTLVDPSTVMGKVLFSLPLLGYPISFARTQTGLIVLIIIPATIIIYSEILNIKNEIIRISQSKNKKDEEVDS